MKGIIGALSVLGLWGSLAQAEERGAAPVIQLARAGKALVPVVTAGNASDRAKKAAGDLAVYLGRIAGATFEVRPGDGRTGIAVGLAADFPALGLAETLAVKDLSGRERYVLKSHGKGLHVIGATEIAVENAVWDLLQRLGYRQFFPGANWEIVPNTPDLGIAIQADEKPDYYYRRIWYGYGAWDYAKEPYRQWCLRNRCRTGFDLQTGHAYGGIIRKNKAAFDAHPEYYGLVNGERKSSKFCIGNPDVRKLVSDYAVRVFEEHPDRDSISMDPSDGGGWCECGKCAALGSVSDRALTLAGEVAEALNRRFKDKYVGMYAYNYHCPPPAVRAHPNVIVSVATAFIRGGYTFEQICEGWRKQGAQLGIREYYSVNTWDRDLPGRARGGRLSYLKKAIPEHHAMGARFLSAESSDNWGPNGLGYYVASRILWNVKEADRVEAVVDDFLTRSFGPAKETMRSFYEFLDGTNRILVMEDAVARMYRLLDRARKEAPDPAIQARLNDLILYTRYVELYEAYAKALGQERQKAFETLIRHAYRMRRTMMIHTLALYRDLDRRDKRVAIPPEAHWQKPEAANPWKSSAPFTPAELDKILAEGIAANSPVKLDFEIVQFSDDLVPATPLRLARTPPSMRTFRARGQRAFYTYVSAAPATIPLKITGGLIAHYRDRGNVKIDLWKVGGASRTGEKETHVAHDRSVPPDGRERTVTFKVGEAGLYKITVSDGMDSTAVAWPDGTPMTLVSTLDSPKLRTVGRITFYFYVPKGTKTLGLFSYAAVGEVRVHQGGSILKLKRGYLSAAVPPGQDGKLWVLRAAGAPICPMTVPPCFARSADELLLPREVVEKDAPAAEPPRTPSMPSTPSAPSTPRRKRASDPLTVLAALATP